MKTRTIIVWLTFAMAIASITAAQADDQIVASFERMLTDKAIETNTVVDAFDELTSAINRTLWTIDDADPLPEQDLVAELEK